MRSNHAVAVLFALAVLGAPSSAAAVESLGSYNLEPDRPLFLDDGPKDIRTPVFKGPDPAMTRELCRQGQWPCYELKLQVPPGGSRLRAAVDYVFRGGLTDFEAYPIYLADPDGNEVAYLSLYSGEVFSDSPAAGTWTVTVVPFGAQGGGTFRLRALLEKRQTAGRSRASATPRQVLPNLRMAPPFEITFQTPGGALPAALSAADNPQALRGVLPTRGCLPSEIHDYAARRCLRFSTGPENTGRGDLEVHFLPAASGLTTGPAVQRIQRTDGSHEDVPAGEYVYHPQHGHYHHAGYAGMELLRVVDTRTGRLESAGKGPKQGYCMVDFLIARWRAFDNRPDPNTISTCAGVDAPQSETVIGLSHGWTDIYTYNTEGNYVEFGDNPDGRYVVRIRSNDRDSLRESNVHDNYAYAYLDVRGDRIRVLERGYGRSPWDPHKKVATDTVLPATPLSGPGGTRTLG